MTKPVTPKGQEIAGILADLVSGKNTLHVTFADAEQQIREIIALELERKAIGDAETRIQMGMYVPDKKVPNPIDWFRAAANTVRGNLPVTKQQWVEQADRMAGWIEDRARED